MSKEPEHPPSFLGTGWGFPPSFGPAGRDVEMVSDVEDVHQSLAVLVATQPAERVMQPTFGCNLRGVMFEEIDPNLISRVQSVIYDAILEHEPRIGLQSVEVTPDEREPGTLRVQIHYVVHGTNSRFNMVFPFYLNEASVPGL